MGFEVRTANDGKEGLEELDKGEIDLVLMDNQMPVMDGFEATREWRAREERNENGAYTGRMPIIALSKGTGKNVSTPAWTTMSPSRLIPKYSKMSFARHWPLDIRTCAKPVDDIKNAGIKPGVFPGRFLLLVVQRFSVEQLRFNDIRLLRTHRH